MALQDFVAVVSAFGPAEIPAQNERDNCDDAEYCEREATGTGATVAFCVRLVARFARLGPRPPRFVLRFVSIVAGAEWGVRSELRTVEMQFGAGEFCYTDSSMPRLLAVVVP